MAYKIRSANTNDLNFIYSTWLKGQYHGNDFFSKCEKQSYFTHYAAFIMSVIKLETVEIKVACLADDDDVILGYSVCSPWCIYWIYVKEPWRIKGIAKMLVPETITTVASLTKAGESIRKKKGWIFDPWKGLDV